MRDFMKNKASDIRQIGNKDMKSVLVVGAGFMGSGIAQMCA
jgi:hypothetical protein